MGRYVGPILLFGRLTYYCGIFHISWLSVSPTSLMGPYKLQCQTTTRDDGQELTSLSSGQLLVEPKAVILDLLFAVADHTDLP